MLGKFSICIVVFRRLEVLIKSFLEESSSQAHIPFLTIWTSELINLTFFVFVFVVGISIVE